MERSSSPVMSHLREILGENIHSLRVGQISKPNDGKDAHGSAEIQASGHCNILFLNITCIL